VVDDEELPCAKEFVADDEGSNRIVASSPSRITDHVRVAFSKVGVLAMKHSNPIAIPNQTATKLTISTSDLQAQIRLRAYGPYEQRGSEGHDVDDWLQA
jgi:hypothetical protein